jgi:hypothetical protein
LTASDVLEGDEASARVARQLGLVAWNVERAGVPVMQAKIVWDEPEPPFFTASPVPVEVDAAFAALVREGAGDE